MDDRADWERWDEIGTDIVNEHGDIVPPSVWRAHTDSLVAPQRQLEPGSYAARHRLETGHDLAAGCCCPA